MNPPPPAHDLFVDAWAVYRLVVENDYLWHSGARRALAGLFARRFPDGRPVRLLDLACGDADGPARALAGRAIGRYVGVDRSPDALAAAAARLAPLGWPAEFVAADYLDYLRSTADTFDAIYVGLSAHHLDDRLGAFFAAARPRLAPGGVLAVYEPFLLPDETVDEHRQRVYDLADGLWTAMAPTQRRQVGEHVKANDFPVTIDRWNALAAAAGFPPAERLYRSPDRVSEFVAHLV